MAEKIEKTLSKNLVYDGRIFKVYCDDIIDVYENPSKREIIEHNGGVTIAALDDEENILMVRQYRYAIGKNILELPAGKLETGENPLECAKRELIEETGYEAEHFEFLGDLWPSPGYTAEKLYIYFAKSLKFKGQNFDPSEYVELEKIPLKKAYKMVLDNEIEDAKTQIGILKIYNKIKGE